MLANPICKLAKELRLRAFVAFAALGLAVLPAAEEHKARVVVTESEAPEQSHLTFSELAPEPGPEARSALSPDPGLLQALRHQTARKPSFDKKSKNYEALIQTAAREHEVSPALVKAVIQAESRFNSHAVSSQGAVGLMQVLPSTARSVGVRSPQIPKENITAGVRYLKVLLQEFGDEEYLAIAAYNCGPDLVRRYGNKLPPFAQTRVFVAQVMEYYQSHITES